MDIESLLAKYKTELIYHVDSKNYKDALCCIAGILYVAKQEQFREYFSDRQLAEIYYQKGVIIELEIEQNKKEERNHENTTK